MVASITGGGSCDVCGDPASGDASFIYDGYGNPASVTDALGNKTTYTYDPVFNKITSVTDPLGNQSTFAYDIKGNLKSVTDANNNTTTLAYDSFGELTNITDALKNTTTLTYDLGNLASIADPLNNKTQMAFDPVSRLIQTTDALGRSTTVDYDGLDRITSQTNAQNGVTQFKYDENTNLLSLTDAKSNKTVFTYDGMNRLSARTDPLGHADSRQYDFNSNLTKFIDRRGQASFFAYDVLNRVASEKYDDGSSVSRTYDANGRPVNVTDSLSGSFDFVYDPVGRQLSSANQFGTIQYTYDPASRLTSRQVVGQSAVQYLFDEAGNLQSAAMPQAAASFVYDADNRLSTINRANNVSSQYVYDKASNLLSITHSGGSGVNIPLTYLYDAVGNRTQYSTPVGQALFTQMSISTFNQNNQLSSSTDPSGLTSDLYDANGNLISAATASGTTTYTWDTRNRLKSIVQPNGQSLKLLYDAGRNLLQQLDVGPTLSRTQQFILDQLTNVVGISALSGDNLSALGAPGIDQDFAVIHSNGMIEYSLKDGLNSAVGTADQSGTLKEVLGYEPFGSVTVNGGAYPFRYTGRNDITSGLLYERARFPATDAGRFISEDPEQFAGGSVNAYTYADNDPTTRVDPTGLSSVIYDNTFGQLVVFTGNGGILAFPAENNAQTGSAGRWPSGVYDFSHYNAHSELQPYAQESRFGSYGIFVFDRAGCSGCGIHSGRLHVPDARGRFGPAHATNGCIRTTDEAMWFLTQLRRTDPVRRLVVTQGARLPRSNP